MLFRLDLETGVPLYQQVVEQVRRMIASGTILSGDRLPTVRELAAELVVNPNTVAHAYQMLEQAGVVETRRGQGTFACAPSVRMTRQQSREQVAALLDRALAEASLLNVSAEDVLAVWRERLEEWRASQEAREVEQ